MGKYKKNFIFIGISVAALVIYIVFFEGVDKFTALFMTMNLKWLFIGLGCLAGYLLIESVILHIMTRQLTKKQSFMQSVRVSMIGQLFNCITPFASGGQPVQAYEMQKNGVKLGSATTALLCKFIVYQLVLTVYTFIFLIFKIKFFKDNIAAFSYLAIIGFTINCAVAALLISIALFKEHVKRFCLALGRLLNKMKVLHNMDDYNQKVVETVDTFHQDFKQLSVNMPLFIKSALLTAVQLSFYLLIPFTIYRSLGHDAYDPLTIMSAAAFVMMISAFVPIPGTIGAAEGTFYIFFSLFFPSNIIYMAILFWRLYTFYLPILIGSLSTFIQTKKDKAHPTNTCAAHP